MTKEPPIMVVNKTRKSTSRKRTSATTSTRRPNSSKTRKNGGRKGKKVGRRWEVPAWLYYLLMGGAAALVIIGFYYFFIRPYAYRWRPCSGIKAYGVCLPAGYEVYGFDVSHHQGTIDWSELQKTQNSPFPIRFVFLKASEGGDFSDTAFINNFNRAREYGFIRGAYHFYNPKTDAERQAEFFIHSVNLEPGDLPPVLDIEKTGDDENKLKQDLQVWLKIIENHYKVKPILYTSYKFKTRYLNDSIFNTYPYWIAHYYVDSVEYKGDWKFWQHTDAGRLPGIREDVDLNVYNGSLDELKKLTIQQTDSINKVIE
ncbi:glycoside hydrolase family 25 protein [uncultured Bacteroides sp.]|uniref:glycoside hydrolase family 25 protein n=1 Tax=uncultured Bacteroides sp. TaxID=162156 RepID=UPI00261108A1|nr:glycoside hydrolase family 25 protein [uncultured Bacteroides sp.]